MYDVNKQAIIGSYIDKCINDICKGNYQNEYTLSCKLIGTSNKQIQIKNNYYLKQITFLKNGILNLL